MQAAHWPHVNPHEPLTNHILHPRKDHFRGGKKPWPDDQQLWPRLVEREGLGHLHE